MTLPPRFASIEPGDVAQARALVAAVTGMAEPALPFALALLPFAASLLAAIPHTATGILIHEALTLDLLRPLAEGERLDVTGRQAQAGGGQVIDLEAAAADSAVARLSVRLRTGPASLLLRAAPRRQASGRPALSVIVEPAQVAAYAALSGDANPIHVDAALARRLDLPGLVVHGTMLAFLIEPALRAAGIDASPRRLAMRLLSPAWAGERLDVHVEGDPGARLRVAITARDGGLRCVADVTVGR